MLKVALTRNRLRSPVLGSSGQQRALATRYGGVNRYRPTTGAQRQLKDAETRSYASKNGPPGGGGGGGGGGMPPGGFGGMRFPGGMNMGGGPQKGETLEQYSLDLTEMARKNELDPIIGRDDEIRRTIQILSRKTKSNPVLIGPPGTGKTAILEGLAQRIVKKEVPESLQNKRLLTIDLASLIAGSGIRGQFEEKFKNLLADIQEAQREAREEGGGSGGVICFIDELHTLLNLGKAEGSMDAGNMIKPALARGLQLVGATTLDEYRKYIEKDQALARRFQPITVEAPSIEATIAILRGLKPRYESHFGVQISDGALVQAAVYSDRYIPDRFLPDKAIDLLDEAASSLKLSQESKPVSLENLGREITTLQIERESLKNESDTFSTERLQVVDDLIKSKTSEQDRLTSLWQREKSRVKDIKRIKREIDTATDQLEIAQRESNYELASRLRYSTIPALKAKLPKEQGEGEVEGGEDMLIRDRLTAADIAKVVAKSTGIPVENLRQGETEKLLHIEDALKKRVVGQEAAITAVAKAIRLSRAGLQSPNRPLASFLMLGPSGVGKSSLTKAMAEFLFGDEKKGIIQINMSELSSKHDVSRLLGATPGYIGYDEGGQLTNAVRRRPYAVVVLDEIEKAHPDIQNILLQILEEGELTDGQGQKVSFKNTIICLTSNLGAPEFVKPGAMANGVVTDKTKESVMDYVRHWFRPEVLGRMDETIVFNSLPRSTVDAIVRLRLSELQDRINDRRIDLKINDEAVKILGDAGYSELYGARAVARVIRDQVVSKLTLALLEGRIRNGDTVEISGEGGKIVVKDNHERDTSRGEHVLDLAHDETAEDDVDVGDSGKQTSKAGSMQLPILAREVNKHEWAAVSKADAVTISSETTPGKLVLSHNWLRDNCACSHCQQVSTGQRLHKSSDYFLPEGKEPVSVKITKQGHESGLSVVWGEGHDVAGAAAGKAESHKESFYPLATLVNMAQPSPYTQQDPIFFPTSPWNRKQLLASPTLRIPYAEFRGSPTALQAALAQVVSYGLVVLTGVPTAETANAACELRKAMDLVGEIRNTFYGETWDVKALKDSKNIAYTDVDLGFHQDLLYFESPPRFQALHCLRNKVDGGSSYFADAFAAADQLKAREPKLYDILRTRDVPFHYDNDGKWYQRWHKTIEETESGRGLHAVNYSPPFQAPLPILQGRSVLGLAGGATDDLPASLKAFDEILNDKAGQYEFTMQEGDLVFFDNRRVLHARRAFKQRTGAKEPSTSAGEPTRWLKGCYLDGDVVWNRLRQLTREGQLGQIPLDSRWKDVVAKTFGSTRGAASA